MNNLRIHILSAGTIILIVLTLLMLGSAIERKKNNDFARELAYQQVSRNHLLLDEIQKELSILEASLDTAALSQDRLELLSILLSWQDLRALYDSLAIQYNTLQSEWQFNRHNNLPDGCIVVYPRQR